MSPSFILDHASDPMITKIGFLGKRAN